MARITLLCSLLGAGLAFGAACATLALMGLGVPMLLGAVGAAAGAGLVLNAALRTALARPTRPVQAEAARADAATSAAAAQLADIEARAATLRHDLRGVLSPALMVTDRLLNHKDPGVQRAGQAVVRSVQRATDLIQASRSGAAASPDTPAGRAAG